MKGEKSTLPPPPPAAPIKVVKGQQSNIPPPPPPPPAPLVKDVKEGTTGYININGKTHFYTTENGLTKYYNRFGYEVDKKGNKLSSTQTAGDKVVKGQKITKVYKDGKVVSEFKKTWKDDDIPPPPPKVIKVEASDSRQNYPALPQLPDNATPKQHKEYKKQVNAFEKNTNEKFTQQRILKLERI